MAAFSRDAVVKQILGNGGFGALGQVASFLGVLVFTQLVPQGVLGSYFLLVAVLQVTSFVGVNGVSTDITRRISQSGKPGRELSTAAAFTLLVTGVLAVCAVLALPVVETYVGNGLGRWLVVLLPITIFGMLTRSVLKGEQKNTRAAGLIAAQRITTYTVGSGCILAGIEPGSAIVFGLLSGKLLDLAGGVALIDTSPVGLPTTAALRQAGYRARNITAASLGSLGQEWTDTLLIGSVLTPEAVALYEIAWRLSAVGLISTNAVTSVLYPRFAEAAESGNQDAINRYAQRAFFYVSVPMIALAAGTLALGTDLVTVLYGIEYSDAFLPLLILFVGRFPYSLSRITTMLGYSYDLDTGVTRASVIAALVNAGIDILLISQFGIVGAAIGSLLSYTLLAVLLFRLVSDRIDYPRPKQFGPSVVAAGVMVLVIRVFADALPTAISSLGVLVAGGAILFSGVLLALSPTVQSDVRRMLVQAE